VSDDRGSERWPCPKCGLLLLQVATTWGSMVGRGRRAVEGCGVPWMSGTMQSAERPLPFLALPKTNPASRHACRICSHGRSVAAVDGVVVDGAAEGEVAAAGGGVAADGFAFPGEGPALMPGAAGGLVWFLIAAAGTESAFLGCSVTAGAGVALKALSGTLLVAEIGGGVGRTTVGAVTVDGEVVLAVVGAEGDRLAASAKWMAAAIPPTASTASRTAATIQGVRDGSFFAASVGPEVSATVGATTAAEVLTVLTARECPEVVSRCRRFRSARRSLAVW